MSAHYSQPLVASGKCEITKKTKDLLLFIFVNLVLLSDSDCSKEVLKKNLKNKNKFNKLMEATRKLTPHLNVKRK